MRTCSQNGVNYTIYDADDWSEELGFTFELPSFEGQDDLNTWWRLESAATGQSEFMTFSGLKRCIAASNKGMNEGNTIYNAVVAHSPKDGTWSASIRYGKGEAK